MNTRYFETEAKIRDTKKLGSDRRITYILSTGDKDRHNTVLNMDNWQLDNYRKNPIVLFGHQTSGKALFTPPDIDNIIGRMENLRFENISGKKALLGDIVYEPDRKSVV